MISAVRSKRIEVLGAEIRLRTAIVVAVRAAAVLQVVIRPKEVGVQHRASRNRHELWK